MSRWLATAISDVRLRPLAADDVGQLSVVIAENHAHLTAGGDYRELVALDAAELAAMLSRDDVDGFLFGIFERGALRGVVSLVPVDPPRYGCGYWLAESATGRGVATVALRSLVDHARDALHATAIFAGISHGNERSAGVVTRVGFTPVAVFPSYTRYGITWDSQDPRSASRTPAG